MREKVWDRLSRLYYSFIDEAIDCAFGGSERITIDE